jgi:uncharacterized protein (TIGR03435 family)
MTQRIGSKDAKGLFLIASILAIIFLSGTVLPRSSALAFEVVSVKLNKPGDIRDLAIRYLPGGRFSAQAVPIPLLILDAYDTPRLYPSPEFQKLDLGVIERNLYDIEAIAGKDTIPPGSSARVRNEKIRAMLQTLLTDRFKLKVHREMKEQSVYAIVVAKNGPKFQSAATEECADKPTNFFDPGSCHSIADLIRVAQRTARLELPLIDKTGLTGLYNIPSLDWSSIIPGPRTPDEANPSRPTFSDVLDKLGLKLETQKATVEMLVVDHIEPPTMEN